MPDPLISNIASPDVDQAFIDDVPPSSVVPPLDPPIETRGHAAPLPGQPGFDSGFPGRGAPPIPQNYADEMSRIENNLREEGCWFPRAFQSPFIAKITTISLSANNAGWQEECYVGGSFSDFSAGRNGTSGSGSATAATPLLANNAGLTIGQLVIIYEILDPSTKAYVYKYAPFDGTVFVSGLLPLTDAAQGLGYDTGMYTADYQAGKAAKIVPITGENAFMPAGDVGGGGGGCLVLNGAEGGLNGGTASIENPHMLCALEDGQSSEAHAIYMGRIIGIVDASDRDFPGYPVVLISEYPPPAIPVWLTKDGGSDGTSSTKATWTYTMNNSNGEMLGTGLTPLRPRPLGSLSFANGSDPFLDVANGIAYIISGGDIPGPIFILWDAGEVPNYTAVLVITGPTTTTTVLTPNIGPSGTTSGFAPVASDGSV